MSGADSSKKRGIWSKLLIWVVVIVAGFFYLRALDEKRTEERQQEAAAQIPEAPPVESGEKVEVDVTETRSLEAAPPPELDAQPQSPASGEGQQSPLTQESASVQPDSSPVSETGHADSAPAQGQEMEGSATAPAVEAEVAPKQEASAETGKEEQSSAPDESPVPAAVETGSSNPQSPIEFSSAPLAAEPSPVAPTIPVAPPESAAPSNPVVPPASVVEAEPVPLPAASAAPPSSAQPEPAQPSAPGSAESAPAAPESAEPEASSPPAETVEDQRARVMAEQRAMQERYWRQRRPYRWGRSRDWPRTGPRGPYGAYYPGYGSPYYRPWQ